MFDSFTLEKWLCVFIVIDQECELQSFRFKHVDSGTTSCLKFIYGNFFRIQDFSPKVGKNARIQGTFKITGDILEFCIK